MKSKTIRRVTGSVSAALLAFVLAVGAAGCGKKDDASSQSAPNRSRKK